MEDKGKKRKEKDVNELVELIKTYEEEMREMQSQLETVIHSENTLK